MEVWRQLWRVIERSDIIVQIVDARNPLLFRCRDLESYVKEVGSDKINFVLINKADLLTPVQRHHWARYFRQEGIPVAFWSAATLDDEWSQKSTDESSASEKSKDEETATAEPEQAEEVKEDEAPTAETEQAEDGASTESGEDEAAPEELAEDEDLDDSAEWVSDDDDDEESRDHSEDEEGGEEEVGRFLADKQEQEFEAIDLADDGKIINRSQLLELLKSFRPDKTDETLIVGMVGYPNVGKSSSINKLIGQKKVAVSATPGKTKHFQTLFIDDKFCLCDCPGLVMPSFVFSKEQMTINGILPCDEMRDCSPAVGLICSQIDRRIFERVYGIMLPKPGEYDAPDRPPTAHELLTSYAFVRGFMSTKGIPDTSRAARIIIKDYVNGRLRYCVAPPGVAQSAYDDFEGIENVSETAIASRNEMLAVLQRRHLLDEKPKTADIDRTFFKDAPGIAHVKTSKKATAAPLSNKKHHNRNKKEKLRRVYGYLDA